MNCGKQTDNPDGICDECKAKAEQEKDVFFDEPTTAQPVAQPTVTTTPPTNMTRMYGFKKSLAGTILGVIGYVFAMIPSVLFNIYEIFEQTGTFTASELNEIATVYQGMSWFFFVVALPLGILGLIFGIQGINKFKEAKAQGVKPVATLVLGIVGVAGDAVTLLFCLITLGLLA